MCQSEYRASYTVRRIPIALFFMNSSPIVLRGSTSYSSSCRFNVLPKHVQRAETPSSSHHRHFVIIWHAVGLTDLHFHLQILSNPLLPAQISSYSPFCHLQSIANAALHPTPPFTSSSARLNCRCGLLNDGNTTECDAMHGNLK